MGCCTQANTKGKTKSDIVPKPGKKDGILTDEQPQETRPQPDVTEAKENGDKDNCTSPGKEPKKKEPKNEEDMTDSDDGRLAINDIQVQFSAVRKSAIEQRVKKIMLVQWIDDIYSKYTFGE